MMARNVRSRRRPIAFVPHGDKAQTRAVVIAQELREAGYMVEMSYSGNMKRRLARANKVNARAALFLGEDELAKNVAAVRNMETGEQVEVPLASLVTFLDQYR